MGTENITYAVNFFVVLIRLLTKCQVEIPTFFILGGKKKKKNQPTEDGISKSLILEQPKISFDMC